MDAGVRPAREPNLTLLVRRRSMVQSSVLQRSSRDWGFGNERAGQRRAVGRRGGSSPRWSGLRQRRAARWYESRLPCHSARERLSPPTLPPPPERAFDLPALLRCQAGSKRQGSRLLRERGWDKSLCSCGGRSRASPRDHWRGELRSRGDERAGRVRGGGGGQVAGEGSWDGFDQTPDRGGPEEGRQSLHGDRPPREREDASLTQGSEST